VDNRNVIHVCAFIGGGRMKNSCVCGVLFLSSALALLSPACGPQHSPQELRAADERAIRAVDDATKRAAQAKDADGVVDTWYADDGSALYPNAPICTGKEALRARWAAMLATPGFTVDWQITKVVVSRAGDLAYTPFTYEMTRQGPAGKLIHDYGKGLAVWKKQPDRKWKGEADIFNSDLPLPQPPRSVGMRRHHRQTNDKRHRHH
jgi:ketosteroid isomerase-like protein